MANIVRVTSDNLLVDKTKGKGIQVDLVTPTFGFRDIIGQVYPDPGGPDAPSIEVWRGNNRRLAYGAGDRMSTEIHMPHDLVQADMFGHFHWGHNGSSISGDLVLEVSIDHSKGHEQAGGSNITKTITLASGGVGPYITHIEDTLFATSGGGAGLLDSDTIEPDDSIHIEMIVTSIPTITGGSGAPFIWNADIHAQTTGVLGTKNKSPNFYT